MDLIILLNKVSLLAEAAAQPGGSSLMGLLPMLIMIVPLGLMIFFQMRSSKKQRKEEQALRDNLRVGDEIVTNAGIVGRILAVKDDEMTIETGTARTKLTLKRWAIATVNTVHADDDAPTGHADLDEDLYGDD